MGFAFGESYYRDRDKLPRYERQLFNVNELVLSTAKKRGVDITMKEMYKLLEVLYEYRVIE